jgi:nucleoside-diphosphate-sugar epimerase
MPGEGEDMPMTDPGSVVVLGGSGFIGRQIGSAFAQAGRPVVTVSRSPAPNQHAARFVQMDLGATEPGRLTDLLLAVRPSVIVNAVGAVWTASERMMLDVNATMVAKIVNSVAELPYRARLIHIGSVHEYAPTPVGRCIDASTPQYPVGVYGWTKLLGSNAVLQATADGQIDGVVLRLATVIGAGAPRDSLLGGAAERLSQMRGENPAILRFGALMGERDFLDVRDAAAAVTAAATRPMIGQAINIGRGRAVSVRRLVEMLIAISGLSVVIEETDQEWTVRKRDSGTDWLQVDIVAADRVLGWKPQVPLTESLRALWEERTSSRTCHPPATRGIRESRSP